MGKLKFKGEPKKAKHKSRSTTSSSSHRGKGPEGTGLEDDDVPEDVSGWISIPSPALALGPLYLTLPTTSLTPSPVCLALQPTTGKVFPFVLPEFESSTTTTEENASTSHEASLIAANLDAEELEALVVDSSLTESTRSSRHRPRVPEDIHHVWVCTRIPDSQDKVTLRSATGKYLAADQVGQVTADREARGMLEEWSIEPSSSLSGSVVLRSSYGKLLSVDVVAGGKIELRADEENEGETERWNISMQLEFLSKAKKQFLERMGTKTLTTTTSGIGAGSSNGLTIVGDLGTAEQEQIRKFQARGQGRLAETDGDLRKLEKARKKGEIVRSHAGSKDETQE